MNTTKPFTGRNISLTEPTEPKSVDYGFSTRWMEAIQLPSKDPQLATKEERQKAYGDRLEFIKQVQLHHDSSKGFFRWCLGEALNQLKPIAGKKSDKMVAHGEWGDLMCDLYALGISEDLCEEARWVNFTFDREQAQTMSTNMGWTEMRKIALEARKEKGKGKLKDVSAWTRNLGIGEGGKLRKRSHPSFNLPDVHTRLKDDLEYYQGFLKKLPEPGKKSKFSGEGVEEMLVDLETTRKCIVDIKNKLKQLTKGKP